ncbi:YadA-like family protein [Aureimonas fodinaquatilis]|uniref:YadA-like family protein n=1 Tax=Aureimonas fodinaquatilis TaxID=2565783 RepID=UPI00165DEA7B|nr:YadA-like family protein [Aureimonas fodinaquatilis]
MAPDNAVAQAITDTDVNTFVTEVFGGDSTFTGGVFTGPTYTIGGVPYYNLADAISTLGSRTDLVAGVQFIDSIGLIAAFAALEDFYLDVQNGQIGLVQQDLTTRVITVGAGTDGDTVSFLSQGGLSRRLTGVSAGEIASASTDAINGGQLFSSNTAIAQALGTTVGTDGLVLAPSYALSTGTFTNVGSALIDLDSRTALNSLEITNIINGASGIVRQDPISRAISIGGATDGTSISIANQSGVARTLEGVAAGAVSAGSAEAINGGQLSAVSTSIVSALGGSSSVAPDGTVTQPTYTVLSQTYNSVGAAFGAINTALGNIESNNFYFAARTTGAPASATGIETVAAGGGAAASGSNAVAVGSAASASGTGSIALGAGATASGVNSVAIGAGVNAGGANQIVIGGPGATYTLAGITSEASYAAQQGPVEFVTSDASGNLASVSLDSFFNNVDVLSDRVGVLESDNRSIREGVAIALALGGVQLPSDKSFAISANVGMFEREAALGFGAIGQIHENIYLNGGVGVGTSHGTVAGRIGASFAW